MKYFIIMISALFMFSACNKKQSQIDNLLGVWKYEKNYSKQYTKLGRSEFEQLPSMKVHIEKDKIYAEGVSFFDTCHFSEETIKQSMLLDTCNDPYYWYEESDIPIAPLRYTGPLVLYYSKEELSKFECIDFGCHYHLSTIFKNEDTLIFNYLGGAVVFFTKE